MKRILAQRSWTDPQRKWLLRIGEQVTRELIVDRDALDQEPFQADGGFNRLNRIFEGQLEAILGDINEELWRKIA
jgi:type I restriction enzyme, R subunit